MKQGLEKLSPELFTSIIVYKMFPLHVSQEVALEFCPVWAIWTTKLRFLSAFIPDMQK
jgi:hypothetical protein